MRRLFIAILGLSFSVTLVGCGGSATIPTPPAQATALPPGSSPEMTKPLVGKGGGLGGGMAPAKPAAKK